MPAHNPDRKKAVKKKVKSKFRFRLLTIIFFILLFVIAFAYINLTKKFWDGESKLAVVINNDSGDVSVAVFDPEVGEIVDINISGETEVGVSRQLGTFRIKSVWQLGANEGLDGKLLAETVTRHFKFPVTAWAGSAAEGFIEGTPGSYLSAVFSPYKTNLSAGDRIFLAAFSLGVKGSKKLSINLAETTYLTKTRLTDGGEGFVVSGTLPQNLLVAFSDSQISKSGTKVVIKNASTRPGLAEEVGGLTEVLGAKVVAIKKEPTKDSDCVVSGKEKEIAVKFASIFGCSVESYLQDSSFDLQIVLGEEFARRY